MSTVTWFAFGTLIGLAGPFVNALPALTIAVEYASFHMRRFR